ncbi:permease prefix domain 1-containing protein [Candidatus Aminicenantes bacterium AC-335-G13]|nr:permease prefix domain 1-containing protein [Candidatus Aminicenantes bacterium AC-335-G13]
MDLIRDYLSGLSKHLKLSSKKREEILKEIKYHLEDLSSEYKKEGISMKEAKNKAIKKFDNPKRIARKLQWVHGFGSFSENKFKDSSLGTLPFLIATILILLIDPNFLKPNSYFFGLFWISVIGFSVYGFLNAFPAWTISWLGFFNVLILQLLFFAGGYISPLFSIVFPSLFLIFSIYFIVKHPYTIALWNSLPAYWERRKVKIKTIPGLVPNLLNPPQGCTFHPRCLMKKRICSIEEPPQIKLNDGIVKCWLY